jgi:hypothetical protein
MITRLYELLTGQPWTTTRSMAAEFGPPPAARYATQLAAYSDAELIAHGKAILARLRAEEATQATRQPTTGPAAGPADAVAAGSR